MSFGLDRVFVFLGVLIFFAIIGFLGDSLKEKKNSQGASNEWLHSCLGFLFSITGIFGVIVLLAARGLKYSRIPLALALVLGLIWRCS